MASKKIRRRDLIQQVVQERGSASVGSLAEMLGVSTQTIRRDLDTLCEDNALNRVHGKHDPERSHGIPINWLDASRSGQSADETSRVDSDYQ